MSQKLIKIESIKKLKRPGFYQLITSDEDLTISDDIIVKFNLYKDLELTDIEYQNIKKENEKNNYFLKACNYIFYQMRSEWEVEEYLKKYQLNEEDIIEIINKLKQLQFIDDDILCKLILESSKNALKGPNYFKAKVKKRKLNVNINNYVYDADEEESIIKKLIDKNINKIDTLPIKKQKQYIYSKLLRDGFSNDIINYYINTIEYNDNSDISLDKDYDKLLKKYQKYDDKTKKKKIISSLLQKGYSYTQITHKISSIDLEDYS